jgi:hypothetical protein
MSLGMLHETAWIQCVGGKFAKEAEPSKSIIFFVEFQLFSPDPINRLCFMCSLMPRLLLKLSILRTMWCCGAGGGKQSLFFNIWQ